MAMPEVSNSNDYKVVTFTNKTDFGFTPEMGSMYDGRPIFGISGEPVITAGESIVLPYHVGNLIARNLAKAVLTRRAPVVDPAGIPTGVPLWNEGSLEELRQSFLTELYTENKPAPVTETDRLMAKVEEYKAMVDKLLPKDIETPTVEETNPQLGSSTYVDKAEVIAELTKRGIKFDARQNKSALEKLLV